MIIPQRMKDTLPGTNIRTKSPCPLHQTAKGLEPGIRGIAAMIGIDLYRKILLPPQPLIDFLRLLRREINALEAVPLRIKILRTIHRHTFALDTIALEQNTDIPVHASRSNSETDSLPLHLPDHTARLTGYLTMTVQQCPVNIGGNQLYHKEPLSNTRSSL